MDARRGIVAGMTVCTPDGEKLGKVVDVDEAGLFVEKGFLFPKEYGFPYEDVAEVRDGTVVLRLGKQEISSKMVNNAQGLERRRPSAVSDDRSPGTATAPGRADPTAIDIGPHVIGTGTEQSLLVDQAEPIIEETEEEVASAGRAVPDAKPKDDSPRTQGRDPKDRHVP